MLCGAVNRVGEFCKRLKRLRDVIRRAEAGHLLGGDKLKNRWHGWRSELQISYTI